MAQRKSHRGSTRGSTPSLTPHAGGRRQRISLSSFQSRVSPIDGGLFRDPVTAQLFHNTSFARATWRGWRLTSLSLYSAVVDAWRWAADCTVSTKNGCRKQCDYFLLLEDDAVLPPCFTRLLEVIVTHLPQADVIWLDSRQPFSMVLNSAYTGPLPRYL